MTDFGAGLREGLRMGAESIENLQLAIIEDFENFDNRELRLDDPAYLLNKNIAKARIEGRIEGLSKAVRILRAAEKPKGD